MSGNTIQYLQMLLHGNRQIRKLFFDDQNKLKIEAAYYFRWMQRFCCADQICYRQNPNTGVIDPYATHVAAGRQEVWLEHQKRLNLDTDDIYRKLEELKQEEKQWLTP